MPGFIARHALLPLVIAVTVAIALSQGARAQAEVRSILELGVPGNAAVGDVIVLTATLTADGAPVPDAEIVFIREARFMNTTQELEIARAVTDASGTAVVDFGPRSEGDLLIFAEFEGSEGLRPAFAESGLAVSTGPPQYQEEAGISVPGINVSFLVAILSAIWITFLVVMSLVWRIARDGSLPPLPEGRHGE